MRALLKDKEDGTLILIAVTETCYDPESMELCLYAGETCYTIEKITQVVADSLIQELYENGKADFTQFTAAIEK